MPTDVDWEVERAAFCQKDDCLDLHETAMMIPDVETSFNNKLLLCQAHRDEFDAATEVKWRMKEGWRYAGRISERIAQ